MPKYLLLRVQGKGEGEVGSGRTTIFLSEFHNYVTSLLAGCARQKSEYNLFTFCERLTYWAAKLRNRERKSSGVLRKPKIQKKIINVKSRKKT